MRHRMDVEGEVHLRGGRAHAPVGQAHAYLVFFARDPVDDALAAAILDRVRTCPGAGWFDDPGADSPAERTTGGYVQAREIEEPAARELLEVARLLSADHAILVEVQWREKLLGLIEAGTWRPPAPEAGAT